MKNKSIKVNKQEFKFKSEFLKELTHMARYYPTLHEYKNTTFPLFSLTIPINKPPLS